MPNILLSDPTRRKAYRLRCEVVGENGEILSSTDRSVRAVAERFIGDMEKRGWHWMGGDFEMSEPIPWVDVEKTEVQDVIPALEAPRWRYFLSTVFWKEESIYREYLVDEDEPVWYPTEIMEELYGRGKLADLVERERARSAEH